METIVCHYYCKVCGKSWSVRAGIPNDRCRCGNWVQTHKQFIQNEKGEFLRYIVNK